MRKPYQSPRLTEIMQLGEAPRRELLAVLFLNADNVDRWLYRRGIFALFCTESACMERNCHLELAGKASLPRFHTELLSFSRDLLTAAQAVLREAGVFLSFSVTGIPTAAAVLPRPLQFAIISLLRIALTANPGSLVAALTVTRAQFLLTVTADRIPPKKREFSLCATIAALHGGRLLYSDRTVGFHFSPETKPSADPRWISPGIDGLLKDRLSCVRLGLYSLSEENSSPEKST